MKFERNNRGFGMLIHEKYPYDGTIERVAQHSSAIGDYKDSFDKPGSSYLWVGENHHLNREEVKELVKHLKNWLKTGSLEM